MSPSLGFVAVPLRKIDPETGKQFTIVRYDQFVWQLLKPDTEKIMKLHAALGICGEAGEFADAVKKSSIYGQPENTENLVEELGDLLFYIQAAINVFHLDYEEIMQHNANKLAQRYEKLTFTTQESIDRKDKKEEKK